MRAVLAWLMLDDIAQEPVDDGPPLLLVCQGLWEENMAMFVSNFDLNRSSDICLTLIKGHDFLFDQGFHLAVGEWREWDTSCTSRTNREMIHFVCLLPPWISSEGSHKGLEWSIWESIPPESHSRDRRISAIVEVASKSDIQLAVSNGHGRELEEPMHA